MLSSFAGRPRLCLINNPNGTYSTYYGTSPTAVLDFYGSSMVRKLLSRESINVQELCSRIHYFQSYRTFFCFEEEIIKKRKKHEIFQKLSRAGILSYS